MKLSSVERRSVLRPRLPRHCAFALLLGMMAALHAAAPAQAETITCSNGDVPPQAIRLGGGNSAGQQPDLQVTGACTVSKVADYYYANVNILDGGTLDFEEAKGNNSRLAFWASSIIVEKGGTLVAGQRSLFGANGGMLTIYLYGANQSQGDPAANQGQGALCRTKMDPVKNIGPCGIPLDKWNDNGKTRFTDLPGGVADFFYQYGPLYGDGKCTDGTVWTNGKCGTADGQVGYFGYKVLAVSYGGKLLLNGYKGQSLATDPRSSGTGWLRLAANLKPGDTTLLLSDSPGEKWWRSADGTQLDKIVVTTTDYLPGHSEELTIDSIQDNKVTFHPAIKWPHNGVRFPIASRLGGAKQRLVGAGMDENLINSGAETRAAVALLTRSIRIVSAGDKPGQTFEQASSDPTNCQNGAAVPNCYSFGAHTVFRQGFAQVQIQGVELENLGQAGKLGHYPIHFHMARQVPDQTFVRDSVMNKSMTRWIVLHSTQGATLQRNVGYLSIGHGFYLESGTEIDNRFYSNLGIFARAAVDNPQNPRKVPGILAASGKYSNGTLLPTEAFPYRSDYDHPSVFWITNGWNDFIGNMAAGAGTCGAAYWFVPAWNSDMADVPTPDNTQFGMHMKWTDGQGRMSFAGLQKSLSLAASTPLKSFYGNYATSTMNSFEVIGNTTACQGVVGAGEPGANTPNHLTAVASFSPQPKLPGQEDTDMYYPHVAGSGRHATKCPLKSGAYDCSQFTSDQMASCNNGAPEEFCMVTVLDHFTTSFHWAEKNLAAVWLRDQWYLIDNSVITDVQNAGLTFVSSGGYDRSSVIEGDWTLLKSSVLIGHTQTGNAYAADAGPFSNGLPNSLTCDSGASPPDYCLSSAEGIVMLLANFGVSQRLFSIYDGPAYEDSNAYLDITKTTCTSCMYAHVLGIRKDDQGGCYLPNAAIGWKQPNGFFYPPSFHSTNLFFDNVDIRHYVIDALLQENTYLDDPAREHQDYCEPIGGYPTNFFQGYTDIDRQTELNDDDGSLTGLTNDVAKPTGTISVNPVEFFNAPVETAECLSDLGVTPDKACPVNGVLPKTPTPATAKTSPYDYVTTVVYPDCGVDGAGKDRFGRCGDDKTDQVSGNPPRWTMQQGRGGQWSSECTNEACYGVTLYRQYLTGDKTARTREWKRWFDSGCDQDQTKAECRWPFVRMGGQNTYQRNTLTVNHGTYYLDTSVSRDTQWHTERFTSVLPCDFVPEGGCAPRSVNVFQGGQTYYMFFIYAKRTTQQTYQIYVGPGFNLDTDLKAVQATINTMPVNSFNAIDWPSGWDKHYNDAVACPDQPNCGILQVTVDFGALNVDPIPDNGLCLPHNFCKASGTSCGCALDKNDPLAKANPNILQSCNGVCSTWAVKDLDYPKAGPIGFSFKMPAGFQPDDMGLLHRPKPRPFPATPSVGKPDWLTQFARTLTTPDKASGGRCYYEKLPGTSDCPIP